LTHSSRLAGKHAGFSRAGRIDDNDLSQGFVKRVTQFVPNVKENFASADAVGSDFVVIRANMSLPIPSHHQPL
jgi:hypothetical protein